jgi:hypothetical protein
MTPKLWKVRLQEADGRERVAYTQWLGACAEDWVTRKIYDYTAVDRHAGEVTAKERVAQA